MQILPVPKLNNLEYVPNYLPAPGFTFRLVFLSLTEEFLPRMNQLVKDLRGKRNTALPFFELHLVLLKLFSFTGLLLQILQAA